MMTATQREEIKALFAQLGVTGAHEKFTVIEEVTGTRISSVRTHGTTHLSFVDDRQDSGTKETCRYGVACFTDALHPWLRPNRYHCDNVHH